MSMNAAMPHPKTIPPTPKSTSSFQWTTWLSSPKVPPSDTNDDDGSFSPTRSKYHHRHQQQRRRRATFDDTAASEHPPTTGGPSEERVGESYFVDLRSNFDRRSSFIDIANSDDTTSLVLTASRSAETDNDDDGGAPSKKSSSRTSHSLLTAFLFHLNSLLPEYCDRLSAANAASRGDHNASSFRNSTNGGAASEAVAVLERGAKTIATAFGGSGGTIDDDERGGDRSPQCSSPARTVWPSSSGNRGDAEPNASTRAVPSSAPSSPSFLGGGSPRTYYMSPPRSDYAGSNNPAKLAAPDLSHWLLPLSPSREHSPKTGRSRKLSPMRRTPKKGRSKRSAEEWNSIVESEWERFVSPFLMLVGAECLYGKMEHVLDPKVSKGEESPDADESPRGVANVGGLGKEDGTTSFVKFAMQQSGVRRRSEERNGNFAADDPNLPRPRRDPPPPADANRRGSRRLISMYRQIREDLIIVGEYLCDPVLGARAASPGGGGGGERPGRPSPRMPAAVDSSRSSSPTKGAGGGNGGHRPDPRLRREQAAISLRHSLDALASHVDARCVLVQIHAELCCPPPRSRLRSKETGDGGEAEGGRGGDGKWKALAEECRSVSGPVAEWAKERGWRIVSDLERELRAMELALTSIHYLFECNLFHCVLNIRRLHVLLNKVSQPTHKTSLPMMYIQSSLPEVLAMMHIYFAVAESALEMLRGKDRQSSSTTTRSLQSSGLTSKPNSWNKLDDALHKKTSTAKSKVTDYDSFFAEFVGKNENGPPLAVALVHKTGGRRDTSAEERQGDNEKQEDNPESSVSWDPVYMKSNVNHGNAETGGDSVDGRNSIFKRGQGPNLVRIIKENFSTDRDTGTAKRCDSNLDNAHRAKKMETRISWPFNEWPQVERLLTNHSSATEINNVAKRCMESFDAKPFVSKNDITRKMQRRSSTSKHSKLLSQCYISSITDSICLIVIQSVGNANSQPAPEDEILTFMRMMVSKLCPENLLSIKEVMRLKSDMLNSRNDGPEPPQPERSQIPTSVDGTGTDAPAATSLWSESGWSDAQRKKILHSLGLRGKHSPVMTPLKSPYVKRQIRGKLGRSRKKKTKNSINHAHLDFFLGPELSRLL